LFLDEVSTGHPGLKIVSKNAKETTSVMSPIDQIMMANANELAIVVIAPTLVNSGDFVYIMDDIHRQKYQFSGVRKAPLAKDDVTALFSDLAPRMFNIDLLWEEEFSPEANKENDALILVLEKEKAVTDIQALIGRCNVKEKADFAKYKKKQTSSFSQFNQ
jgi:hypothetical protein